MIDHAFQFHCMICYEEFENSPLRYPVILPCGHTYICRCCSDKLDKCMECREPLFITVFAEPTNDPVVETPPPPSQSRPLPATAPPRSTWGQGAVRPSGPAAPAVYATPSRVPQQQFQQSKPIKKRLPMPKNVVLLSLIEATQMISDAESIQTGGANSVLGQQLLVPVRTRSGSLDSAPISLQDSHDSTGDEEHQRAELAASVSVGIAGTYAVCCKEGLPIFPSKPKGAHSIPTGEEDVDILVQLFHTDKVKDPQHLQHTSNSDLEGGSEPGMATLAFGDRIQVVSMDKGWAKLARGYGFVRAEKNEIVKVGNAVDKCCILEAMLRTLAVKRRELRAKQSEVDTQFIKLMKHLQTSLQGDEDLTVICRTAFGDEENEEVGLEVTETNSLTEKKEENPARKKTLGRSNSSSYGVSSTLAPIQPNMGFVGSSHSGMYSPSFFFVSGATTPSQSEMRAGAQAWRERQAREKAVNFRSGLSGHMALTSRAHPHEYLGPGIDASLNNNKSSSSLGTRVTSFRMSTHTGLTMSHRKKNQKKSSLPSRSTIQDHIKLTGSM